MAYDRSKNEVDDRSTTRCPVNTERSNSMEKMPKKEVEDEREICRNFTNNRCKRGTDCKYRHPPKTEEVKPESPKRKHSRSRSPVHRSKVAHHEVEQRNPHRSQYDRNSTSNHRSNSNTFPHTEANNEKWLNCCREFIKGNCQRTECRWLHVGQEDEDYFMQCGEISKFVTEQAVRILLEINAPLKGRTVCKTNIQGRCSQSTCHSRHINLMELEREVALKVKEEFQSFLNAPPIVTNPVVGSQRERGMSPPKPIPDVTLDRGRSMEMNPMMVNKFEPMTASSSWTDSRPMNSNANMQMNVPIVKPQQIEMSFNPQRFGEEEMIKGLQQELKEAKLKIRDLQRVEEVKMSMEGRLKLVETEKNNLKDSLALAEEMATHQKQKFNLLNSELKEMDATKLKFGIMARRVLGDVPAIEAKLIPSWSNQMQSPEMMRWQEVCQNLRTLVQNILGVDVASITGQSLPTQMPPTQMASGNNTFKPNPVMSAFQAGMHSSMSDTQSSGMLGTMHQYGSGDVSSRDSNSHRSRPSRFSQRNDKSPEPEESGSSWGNTAPSYGSVKSKKSEEDKQVSSRDSNSQSQYGWSSNMDNENGNSNDQHSFWTGPQDSKKGGYSGSSFNGNMQYKNA